MISFKSFLTEIHFHDIYPKQFHLFYKKWNKILKTSSENQYWCNFTMNPDTDILNKNFSSPHQRDSSHSDPEGIYLYPLSYLCQHPADVWYGRGARFLRVIELVGSPNILHLQTMQNHIMDRILRALGLNDYYLKAAKKDINVTTNKLYLKCHRFQIQKNSIFRRIDILMM